MVYHYMPSMKGSPLVLHNPVSMPRIMLKPNRRREKIIAHVFHEKRIVCLKLKIQYWSSKIRLKGLFSEEVKICGREIEEQIHQSRHQSWGGFPCSVSDCRDYKGRWKIREDRLKWLADLLGEWPQVLSKLIQRGGQMHLVSYIGLIRLINQSHPHPPIRFCRGYFYEMGYRRSAKYFWSVTNDGLKCPVKRSGNHMQRSGRDDGGRLCFIVEKAASVFWGCCRKITLWKQMCKNQLLLDKNSSAYIPI